MTRHPMVALALLALVFAVSPCDLAGAEKRPICYARYERDGVVSYGLVEQDRVRRIEGDLFGSWKPTEETHRLADVKLLVPTAPTKVLACAGNYQSHMGDAPPHPYPEIFFKVPSCLIACGEEIVFPKGAENVHYEAEMVIVIGKRAKDVPKERGLDYVLGVTCGNDVSARDWQKNDVQWWRAKASDTFGPCGPWIISGINYDDLLLQLRLNGEVRQKQRTGDLEHGVAGIVSWASRHVTLEPGDLIFTGTPGKTAAMAPGDVAEVELEGVGILRNRVRPSK